MGKWMPVGFLWSECEPYKKETQPQNILIPDQVDDIKGARFHSQSLA